MVETYGTRNANRTKTESAFEWTLGDPLTQETLGFSDPRELSMHNHGVTMTLVFERSSYYNSP